MYSFVALVCVLSNIDALMAGSASLHWNSCSTRAPLHMWGPVSLVDCRRSCSAKVDCLWLTYTYRSRVCSLHDAAPDQADCHGSVAMQKEMPEIDADITCAMTTCPPLSTCSRDTNICVPNTMCGPPPLLASAVVSGNLQTAGAKVKYTCTDGRASIITCLPTGQWTQPVTCGCGNPPTIANANPTFSGQSLVYTCNYGYEIFGEAIYICLATGHWDTPTFTCVVRSIGLRCESSSQCLEANSHCVEHSANTYSTCVCMPLHEYNPILRTCAKVCSAYSTTEFVRTEFTITGFNLEIFYAQNVPACLTACTTKYGDACPGFDFSNSACYCSSVSLQQATDSQPSEIATTGYFHSRNCIPV